MWMMPWEPATTHVMRSGVSFETVFFGAWSYLREGVKFTGRWFKQVEDFPVQVDLEPYTTQIPYATVH